MTTLAFLYLATALAADLDPATQIARISLGERLFHDARFSSPAGDMATSCSACHLETGPQGTRAFTEQLAKSWHPWRNEDPGRDTLRNTPTLLDVALMPRLHYDGEFASLEEQVEKTVVGRNFGWMPDERAAALERLRDVILRDGDYGDGFYAAFGEQPTAMESEALLASVGIAVADFMRTLRSEHDSLYDEFMTLNKLPDAPDENESPKAYGVRVIAGLANLEEQGKLARPFGFDHEAYEGLKIFFRTEGRSSVGNCVTCHVPPHFTDFAFHNIGMTQDEYETVHGADSFEALEIPADVDGPVKRLMSIVSKSKPGYADLGLWNFAGDNRAAAVGQFKTPTLRHLAATDPYGHSGFYPTIERAIEQKFVSAFLYRMGRLRNGDPEMEHVRISEDDVPALFAFLNALNNRGERLATPTPLNTPPDPVGDYYRSPGERRY